MVIHLSRVPTNVCEGRDKYEDELYQESRRMSRQGLSGVVQTKDGIANFSGNTNCPRCKAWLKASKRARERMTHTNA